MALTVLGQGMTRADKGRSKGEGGSVVGNAVQDNAVATHRPFPHQLVTKNMIGRKPVPFRSPKHQYAIGLELRIIVELYGCPNHLLVFIDIHTTTPPSHSALPPFAVIERGRPQG